MPLRKPTNFLNMDLTFTVANKGVVNNAGDLKLDAADGFFIAPQKGIKFSAMSGRVIDFSNIASSIVDYLFYQSSDSYWRADGFVMINRLWQNADNDRPFMLTKCTVAVTAPGVGKFVIRPEPGTNPGTLKLVSYAGTSTTPTVLQDNVGAGN